MRPPSRVPEWVRLPAFLKAQLAAGNATTVSDLPYRSEGAARRAGRAEWTEP
jgi:hypothetical protein